jgi:hypothetical protein
VLTSTQQRPALRTDRTAVAFGAAGAVLSGSITVLAVRDRAGSDFRAHLALVQTGMAGGHFPGDMLFYWLEACLSGFRPVEWRLVTGLVLILTVAGGLKAYLTVRLIAANGPPIAAGVLATLCLFAFGLPMGADYPGFIPPNVWHNSTTSLLMPLALGLFLASLAYLRAPSGRLLWLMLLLVSVNVAAKPSFALCWLMVFPAAVLLRERRVAALAGPVAVCLAGGLLLVAQYLYVYVLGGGDPDAATDGVRIAPLHTWSYYSHDIVWSFVASYAFPLAALALGGRGVRDALAVRYALALAAVGLGWFAVMAETGHREYHGNFMWQAIVTNYVLFAAILGAVLQWLRESRFGWRQTVVLFVFALHVAGGLHYLGWWLTYNAP